MVPQGSEVYPDLGDLERDQGEGPQLVLPLGDLLAQPVVLGSEVAKPGEVDVQVVPEPSVIKFFREQRMWLALQVETGQSHTTISILISYQDKYLFSQKA